jgi:hypothetical protein
VVTGKDITSIGVEIDGTIVRIATVLSNKSVEFHEYKSSSLEGSLTESFRHIDKKVNFNRIALTGGQQHLKECNVPEVKPELMRPMLQSVAEDNLPIVPGMASVAAVYSNDQIEVIESDSQDFEEKKKVQARSMIVCAVVSDQIEPIWKKIGLLGVNVSPSSFLLPSDGLYLRVSQSMAELIVVKNTKPTVARFLRIGGLSEIYAEAKKEAKEETTSVDEFLKSLKPDEGVIPPEKIDAYLEGLIEEVKKTVTFWKREGIIVPTNILVIGEGAALPTLDIRLREAQLNPMLLPKPPGYQMEVEEQEFPKFFQALSAAFIKLDNQDYSSLPNPLAESLKNKSSLLSGSLKNAGKFAVALLVLAFVIIGPRMLYSQKLASAKENLASTEEKLANLGEKRTLFEKHQIIVPVDKQAEASKPFLTNAYCVITGSYPGKNPGEEGSETKISSISLSDNGQSLQFSFSALVVGNQGGFTVSVADWIERLEDLKVLDLQPSSYNRTNEGESISFSLSYPRREKAPSDKDVLVEGCE